MILLLILGAAPASALTVTTPVANVSASSPLLADATDDLQSGVSDAVGEAASAACEVTGDETVCSLTILSYRVATDYVRPNGTHVTKVTGGVINVPTYIDATDDGFPDISVTLEALSTANVKMVVERLGTAPATMPLSVEALIADPTTPQRVINVGYDTRETTAPGKWTAQALLTVGTTTSVGATLEVEGAPSSMTVVGGLFTEGPDGSRLDPKQARLSYTPVPGSSTIDFTLSPVSQSGAVSAASPTKAELELLLMDGTSGQQVIGTLDQLRRPVTLVLDKVDDSGRQTDGTSGNTHVQLTTFNDVEKANLDYESITSSEVLARVRLAAGPLPGRTDFTQTPNGLLVDTDRPIAEVAGGVATGVPAEDGDSAVPVPHDYPIESDEDSYVHQDTTARVDSTTFRVAGVEHVSVETTGQQDDRKIEIGARLTSAPLHVLVTNDARPGGTRYDATIQDLPHNFFVAIAPGQSRMLDFCGSSSDLADPCSPAAQASPAGIERIVLHDSHSPSPLFGRATHLNGTVTGIPSTLELDVATREPAGDADPDQNTRVHIDTSRAIGQTILRATDGTTPPDDPADNGLIYHDTPDGYAVIAKVDEFRRAHFDTDPELALDLIAEGGRDFSYDVELPTSEKIHGALRDRPARTTVSLATPEDAPMRLNVSGADADGQAARTPHLRFELEPPEDEPLGRATSLVTEVTGIPPSVELVIDRHEPESPSDPDQNTKVHVDADHAIGQVILRLTEGPPENRPADPADNGVIYQDQPGEPYAVIAKVDGFRSVHLDTAPRLELSLTADPGHDFDYGVHLPPEDEKPAKDFTGVLEDRPATTRFFFENPDSGPLKVHAEGADVDGDPARTGRITLDALHLDDDPAEKIHNVRVDLQDVPAALDLVKRPVAGDPEAIDIDVATTPGDALGLADVKLDNDVPPPAEDIPSLPADGGGVNVFSGGDQFLVHARVKKLRSVSLKTKPELEAGLDVAEPQDFNIFINAGEGEDHQQDNGCDGFDPNAHNKRHVETHDVKIKNLQPDTRFKYVDGDDGNKDECKRKTWRTIEYQADGRADSISYDTNAGDMAHLHAVVGQEGDNPLKVPRQLKVCQAGNDECFRQINRFKDCDFDWCRTSSADISAYVDAFGDFTHVRLDFCQLNENRDDFTNCTRSGVTKGVFIKLNLANLDAGFHHSDGSLGFVTVNTQKHTDDGEDPPNLGANGFIRVIDHTSVAEFVNLNFGYDTSTGPEWDAVNTTFDNRFFHFVIAVPGGFDGEANCVSPSPGPTWDETDDFLHVILRAAGADENDLGRDFTTDLCGI